MNDINVKYFGATWCAPCKVIKPLLNEIISETDLPLTVEFIDIDNDQEAVQQYGIRGIPTLIKVNENGDSVSFIVAPKTKKELLDWLEV